VQTLLEARINLRQAKVLRAILRLGSFTRKRLAEATGQDLTYINQVIPLIGSFLVSTEKIRSGRPGPPEEVLSLTPEGEKAVLAQLSPLIEELKREAPGPIDLATYIPSPKQYNLVRELIDDIEKNSSVSSARLQRVVSLLANISENENLPVEQTIGESQNKLDSIQLSDKQQVAMARIDLLRGKLSWLSVEAPEDLRQQVFAFDLGVLGLKYFQYATKVFLSQGAKEVVESIDYWSTKHVHSVLLRNLTQKTPAALKMFWRHLDAALLPGVYRLVEKIVSPEPSEILDGLLQYYNQYCQIPTNRAVALLDIRRNLMTFAIVERNGPFIAKSVPISAEDQRSDKELVDVVYNCLTHYRQMPGSSAIDRIFVTGELGRTKRFNEIAEQAIGGMHIGDFYRPSQEGYPLATLDDTRLTHGEFSRAAEVGLTLRAAKFLA